MLLDIVNMHSADGVKIVPGTEYEQDAKKKRRLAKRPFHGYFFFVMVFLLTVFLVIR